jgi:flagellar motor component MotA
MDIATIIGIMWTVGLLAIGIGIGSNLPAMLDPPSATIVIGGTLASLLFSFPLKDILGPMAACKIYVLIPPKQMTPDVERNLSVGIEIFRRAGTYASAFGWVGVLIGLAIISKNATPYNLEELRPCLIYLYSSRTLWDCLALPGLPSYPHQTLSDTGRSGNTSVIDQFGRSLCPVC